MEQAAQSIGFLPILEAGLTYSLNPASFLGCFLFAFFLVRLHRVYGYFSMIVGGYMLFWFFIFQALFHLGLFDFLCDFVPGFVTVWHILRILVSIVVLYIGIKVFIFWFQRRTDGALLFLKKVCFYDLEQENRNIFVFGFAIFKSFFWGIFFAFFCGSWPLTNTMVRLFYAAYGGATKNFLAKLFLFEFIILVPWIVIWAVIARMASSVSFREKILGSKKAFLLLSALSIAGGLSVLMYYGSRLM